MGAVQQSGLLCEMTWCVCAGVGVCAVALLVHCSKLPSFLRNLLKDDLGRLRLDVNLEVHAESSGIPVTNATVQEVCELNPQMTSLCVRNCFDVSDAGLWCVQQ